MYKNLAFYGFSFVVLIVLSTIISSCSKDRPDSFYSLDGIHIGMHIDSLIADYPNSFRFQKIKYEDRDFLASNGKMENWEIFQIAASVKDQTITAISASKTFDGNVNSDEVFNRLIEDYGEPDDKVDQYRRYSEGMRKSKTIYYWGKVELIEEKPGEYQFFPQFKSEGKCIVASYEYPIGGSLRIKIIDSDSN